MSFSVVVGWLVVIGYLLFDLRGDLGCWGGSRPEVTLGKPAAYQLERADDNVLASIEGVPGSAASRFERLGKRYEVVAIRGTPILVRREMPGPHLPKPPGAPEPPPDPTPFSARGRLLRDLSAPEYGEAYSFLVERGDAVPRDGHLFILLDGDLPRTGWKVPGMTAGLVLLGLFNLWSVWRQLKRR